MLFPSISDYNLCSLSEDSCKVESGCAVNLVCGSCPPGFKGIQWSEWSNATQQYQHLTEFDGMGTITFPANKVTEDLTSCYKCYCDYNEKEIGAVIRLIVEPWSGICAMYTMMILFYT